MAENTRSTEEPYNVEEMLEFLATVPPRAVLSFKTETHDRYPDVHITTITASWID